MFIFVLNVFCACVLCMNMIYYEISAIVLHANLRLLPILMQIRDGLKLYGLCGIMAKYPFIFQPLFVPGVEITVSAP